MGAWIETHAAAGLSRAETVAPRVGAWIETWFEKITMAQLASHPVWVRGLKPTYGQILQNQYHVAPRVGAWIETIW